MKRKEKQIRGGNIYKLFKSSLLFSVFVFVPHIKAFSLQHINMQTQFLGQGKTETELIWTCHIHFFFCFFLIKHRVLFPNCFKLQGSNGH